MDAGGSVGLAAAPAGAVVGAAAGAAVGLAGAGGALVGVAPDGAELWPHAASSDAAVVAPIKNSAARVDRYFETPVSSPPRLLRQAQDDPSTSSGRPFDRLRVSGAVCSRSG